MCGHFLVLLCFHPETTTLHIEGTEELSLQAISTLNDTSLLSWLDGVEIFHSGNQRFPSLDWRMCKQKQS